ncbi:MAG: DUF523 domain-containing protein [Bilophila wadsworthia]
MSKQYVVSACLAGESCRYDGGCSPCPAVQELVHGAGPAGARKCSGASDAARPSEIRGGRVVAKDGTDVTGAFTCGAEEALRLALENGCTAAILKARSPSCGSGEIYDGSFTGTRVPGEGVFARMAREAGLEIWSEETFTEGR